MPALKSCSDCSGRFAAQYFSDYEERTICRLCDTRTLLQQAVAEGKRKYEELKSSFDDLQEYVRATVGVCGSASQQVVIPADQPSRSPQMRETPKPTHPIHLTHPLILLPQSTSPSPLSEMEHDLPADISLPRLAIIASRFLQKQTMTRTPRKLGLLETPW